jgi:DNA processing protein
MSQHAPNDNERRDWLRLSRTENVGPITFRQEMRRFGSASTRDILTHIHAMMGRLAKPANQGFDGAPTPVDEAELTQVRAKIPENLSPSPVSVDEVIRQCHVSPSVVLTVLLELELAGRLERQAGHRVALIG